MLRWSSRARTALGAALLGLAGSMLAPAGAVAAGSEAGVTVFLKAPDLRALRALSQAQGLSHAQRVAALDKLIPGAAEHQVAAQALTDAGMTVTHQTAWSVSATGPGTTVSATFGAHPAMRAHASAAQRRAAEGPYPSLPASLDGVAVSAFPTSSGPAVFHATDAACGCMDGADFRNAYTTPALTGAGQPPFSGQDSARSLTIATVQLAGWNPTDLTQWAQTPNIGVPGFNAATSLTQVPVDMSAVPGPSTQDDGDTEVDLDQETLLSTDPYAHQRPYFAPNTNAGYSDAFSQVLDDVLQDSRAYQGGDKHIVALSVSWGLCEADSGAAFVSSFEPILMSLLAAGVTVFASSGDDGVYDNCEATSADVDYPASSPEAIGVGATNLNPVGASAPNSGSNWTESAWTCSSRSDCDSNGGSGGGASQMFGKPSFQSVITNSPFSTAANRLVPDIAADGDPQTGFPVYTTDPTDTVQFASNYLIIGGTSLATPESAALFTNVLAAHGATTGIGDIHHALYQAYAADDGSFRDTTTGSNGATGDQPGDPSSIAGTGYDTVTGLGSPLWPALAALFFAPSTPPSAAATLSLAHPHSSSSPRAIHAAWSGTQAASGLPLSHVTVTITRDGQSTPVYSDIDAPASGSTTFTGASGATYVLRATAVDIGGNKSDLITRTLSVPVDDKQFSLHGSWHRVKGSSDIAGSDVETAQHDATASVTATGTSYSLVVRTGPGFGKLSVASGFSTLRTINLYSAHSGTRTVTFYRSGSDRSRTFRFTCLDKKSGHATGTKIAIDGLKVTA